MRKAKILVCLPYFRGHDGPRVTGGTISNYNLISLLSSEYDVTVLTFDKTVGDSIRNLDVNLIHRPAMLNSRIDKYLRWTDFVENNVRDVVEIDGPPSLFISTTTTLFCNEMFDQTATKTIGLVRAFENFGFSSADSELSSRIEYFKRDLRTKFRSADAVRKSDMIVTNSEYMQRRIMDRFKTTHVKTIHPALGFTVEAAENRHEVRHKGAIVGFVNRNRGKNFRLVRQLAIRLPEMRFLIYGTRPKGKAALNLEYCGWEPDREKMFSSAPLWLVPSQWPEPFGRVSIEAQALGCQVFVSNRGGLPETVFSEYNIVPDNHIDHWAAKIEHFFESDNVDRGQYQKEIIEKFSAHAIDDQWLDCINGVILAQP